jgi:hypothetical protein
MIVNAGPLIQRPRRRDAASFPPRGRPAERSSAGWGEPHVDFGRASASSNERRLGATIRAPSSELATTSASGSPNRECGQGRSVDDLNAHRGRHGSARSPRAGSAPRADVPRRGIFPSRGGGPRRLFVQRGAQGESGVPRTASGASRVGSSSFKCQFVGCAKARSTVQSELRRAQTAAMTR